MFEDDLEGISDDDIENISETDDGDSKGEKTISEEKTAVSKQPTKVDALDIAWEVIFLRNGLKYIPLILIFTNSYKGQLHKIP